MKREFFRVYADETDMSEGFLWQQFVYKKGGVK